MPVAERAEDLCSLEDVNDALGVPAADRKDSGEKVLILRAVTDYFENYCHRRFRYDTYTHDGSVLPRLRPHTPQMLVLENPPVPSVTTLTDYNGGTTFDELVPGSGSSGYVLENDAGIIRLVGYSFTYPDFPSVECTYSGGFVESNWGNSSEKKRWGYDEAHSDIRRAAAKAAAWMYRQRTHSLDEILSQSVGGTTVTFREEIAFVRETMNRYRRLV